MSLPKSSLKMITRNNSILTMTLTAGPLPLPTLNLPPLQLRADPLQLRADDKFGVELIEYAKPSKGQALLADIRPRCLVVSFVVHFYF
jgi:hypothetical protein